MLGSSPLSLLRSQVPPVWTARAQKKYQNYWPQATSSMCLIHILEIHESESSVVPVGEGWKKSKAISNLNQTQNKKLPYSDIQELEAIHFYNSHSQNLKPEETIRSYRLTSCISQTIKSHPVIPALSQITCMWLKQDFQSCFGNINGESTTPQNFNWLFQWLIAPLPLIFSNQPQSVWFQLSITHSFTIFCWIKTIFHSWRNYTL